MATTTNYSWTTPDDTALVKDGAAAIRSLGTAIDTTVFNNAGAAIAKTLIDAEGDLIVGDAADAVQRLAVGSNGNVLTVDTTVDGKIKWAAPAGGGKVLQVVSATTTTQTTITSGSLTDTGITVNITPTSATSKILVIVGFTIRAERTANRLDMGAALLRGATTIMNWLAPEFLRFGVQSSNDTYFGMVGGFNYLDNPATTSTTTYKVQGLADSCTSYWQYDNGPSTITLMEIGA